MAALYQRVALGRSDRKICVVTLKEASFKSIKHTGSRSNDIQLEYCAAKVSLDHRRTIYHALSYTWGEPNFTETIYIDGEEFKVTPNLFSAFL
jgi:hypothetical protein